MAGRYLNKEEKVDDVIADLLTGYLSGGFQSVLMEELRIKRGLTYHVFSILGFQKDYGRALISTFTDDTKVVETLKVLEDVIKKESEGLTAIKLDNAKGLLAGQHPMRFEDVAAYLSSIVFFDHVGAPRENIYLYPQRIMQVSSEQTLNILKKTFDWNQQTIVILGGEGAYKALKDAKIKFHEIQIKDYL